MRLLVLLLFGAVSILCLYTRCCAQKEEHLADYFDKRPTVTVVILGKNKARWLPHTLSCLQNIEYPKKKIAIRFYVDNSMDDSLEIVETWIKKFKNDYNKIYINSKKDGTPSPLDEILSTEWTEDRLKHIIKLREKALAFARTRWADYLLMLDADVFLSNPKTLKILVRKNFHIVAPMLISDGLYSNFWGAMSDKYYYERNDDYEKIINREITDCYQVPMVHSAVLVDMRPKISDNLTYDPTKVKDYDGPVDDIITFANSAVKNGIPLTVCNDYVYGFVPIPVDMNNHGGKTNEEEQLLNVKLQAYGQTVEIPLDPQMAKFVVYPPRDRLGLDQVFMINLKRREKRRRFMELSFKELGIEAQTIEAVDGMKLDMEDLNLLSVTLMPKYEDPYHKRPMKTGEIGCFLSHYFIWKDIAKRHIPRTLVLEDDIHFGPFFRRRFQQMLDDLDKVEWEFVYIGRKVLQDEEDEMVTDNLVRPLYSYWTLGYVISEAGARKLINAEPLSKMLPVDEFLPIMFDQHPNETWKAFFPRRDLKALSAVPLLVYPTHYTGQPGYVSDTEDSVVVPESPADGTRGPSNVL